MVAWSRILDAQPEFERAAGLSPWVLALLPSMLAMLAILTIGMAAAVYKVAVSWSDSWGMYVYRRR